MEQLEQTGASGSETCFFGKLGILIGIWVPRTWRSGETYDESCFAILILFYDTLLLDEAETDAAASGVASWRWTAKNIEHIHTWGCSRPEEVTVWRRSRSLRMRCHGTAPG